MLIIKKTPLLKNENQFEFQLKVVDTTAAVMFSVIDEKNNTVDNNNGKLYYYDLLPDTEQKNKLIIAEFPPHYAQNVNLDYSLEEKIKIMDVAYEKNPSLKKEFNYFNVYLRNKLLIDKEKAQAEINQMIEGLIKTNTEESLNDVYLMYMTLGESKKMMETIEDVKVKFPKGFTVKWSFISELQDKTRIDETVSLDYILQKRKEFSEKFGVELEHQKETFDLLCVQAALNEKKWNLVLTYEKEFEDKLRLISVYNNAILYNIDENINSIPKDLEFAEKIYHHAQQILSDRLNNLKYYEDVMDFQWYQNLLKNSYTLLLYKKGAFEKAYELQNELEELGYIDEDSIERMAIIAEKAKGVEFTKDYIETKLNEGIESEPLFNQLENIYQKLGIPNIEFIKYKKEIRKDVATTSKENVSINFPNEVAPEFELTDLEGKKIKLSDYQGKVVVLDFWTTTCGPCLASFPKMQELVNNYKNEKVAFFFININRFKDVKAAQEKLNFFIKKKGYDFQVLTDFEKKVSENYKITHVPTKIVIDKTGKVISVDGSYLTIKELIEANK